MLPRRARAIVLSVALLVWCGLLVAVEMRLPEDLQSFRIWIEFVLLLLVVATAFELGRSPADQDQTVLDERMPAARFRGAVRDWSEVVLLLWPPALIGLTMAGLVLAIQRGEIDIVRAVALGLLSTAFIMILKGWSEDDDRSFGLETRWTGLGGGLGGWKLGRSTTQFLLLVFFGVLIFLLLPPVNEIETDEENTQAGGDATLSESARAQADDGEAKNDHTQSLEDASVQDQEPKNSTDPATEEDTTIEEDGQSPSESQNIGAGG